MHRPPHHTPFAVATPTPAEPACCRASTANDLTSQSAGAQSAALMSLVRALARQATAEVLRAHAAQAPLQSRLIPHPSMETE
jgi:hypothetical protein